MMKQKPRLATQSLAVLMIISTVVAVAIAVNRHGLERSTEHVEICVDLREALTFARREGIRDADYLKRLAQAGVSSVAIEEETLASLADSGGIILISGGELPSVQSIWSGSGTRVGGTIAQVQASPTDTVVIPRSADVASLLAERLSVRLASVSRVEAVRSGDVTAYVISLPLSDARLVNLGISNSSMALAGSAGLGIVARLSNWSGISEKWIDTAIATVSAASRNAVVVFAGTEVMGYPALVPYTARALERAGMRYGDIEFQAQAGAKGLMNSLNYDIVRVHSISRAEVDKGLSISTMVERYTRAARERNIRVLYSRPLMKQLDARPLLDLNEDFYGSLVSSLHKAGFELGSASSFPSIGTGLLPVLGVVLGIIAAWVILLDAVWTLPLAVSAGLVAVGAAGFAGIWSLGYEYIARQAAALGVAIACPSLTSFILLRPVQGESSSGNANVSWVKAALLRLGMASTVSVAGGLMLASCLTELPFIVKAYQFMGVKLMHMLPFLFLPIAYWKYHGRRDDETLLESSFRIANSPVLFWHATLAATIALAGLIYIARTGNTSAIAVTPSALEQSMRAFLENVLPARPRTKEFLLGHPAFVLSAALVVLRRRTLLLPAAALALVGQISIVNTFAHMHTPIALTLTRVISGVLLGAVIGLVVTAVLLPLGKALSASFRREG